MVLLFLCLFVSNRREMEVRENLLQIMDSREVLKIVKAVILKLAVRIHFRIYLTVLTLDEDPETSSG